MSQQVIRRTPNQIFHDELKPNGFYLLSENGKDYVLNETSDGQWEWQDFGSRENAGGTTFDSFETAIEYGIEEGRSLITFESRRGLISELYRRTESKFNNHTAFNYQN